MPIRHLVISGGGPMGFRFLGAMEQLEKDGMLCTSHNNNDNNNDNNNIQSIYGTSVGSIVGAMICLKTDWNILMKYVIDRPWQDVFKVQAKQIFQSYADKGLFDKKIIETILSPLLRSKNYPLNITLGELHEKTGIRLHVFAFELNEFKIVEFSPLLTPDMELVEAVTMSSSLPGVFKPVIVDNKCYIDGGIMCNYPLKQCLRDNSIKEEIMGFKISYNKNQGNQGNNKDCKDGNKDGGFVNVEVGTQTNLLEYAVCLTINAMNYIQNKNNELNMNETIENTVYCFADCNPLSLDIIQDAICNKEFRRKWVQMGAEEAILFMQQQQQQQQSHLSQEGLPLKNVDLDLDSTIPKEIVNIVPLSIPLSVPLIKTQESIS